MFSISRAETFAAGTACRGVGISHLESAVQRVEIIQLATRYIQRTFGIHHHAHATAFDENVAIGRVILQIHLVLQTGATATDHRHAQHAMGTALFRQQCRHFLRRAGREFDQTFIAHTEIRLGGLGLGRSCNHSSPHKLAVAGVSVNAPDLLILLLIVILISTR